METCQYGQISTNEELVAVEERSLKSFLRQVDSRHKQSKFLRPGFGHVRNSYVRNLAALAAMHCDSQKKGIVHVRNLVGGIWTACASLICCGALTIYFSVGISYGAPTIYIQQLRNEANSTDAVSVDMASWLSSVFGYSSLPWVFILTAISHFYGRKKAFLVVSIGTVLMFICFYLSKTTTHLLLTSIMQGITHANSLTISIIIVTEFTSPEYRGVFLTMKTASVFWGVWFSNAIGTFFHWSYIPLLGLFCSSFSLTALIWPESPYWLASKGRFEECKRAHRWLKGRGFNAEKELAKLVSGEIKTYKLGSFKDIKNKTFYMPTVISGIMILQFYSSGKLIVSIYAIEILKKMTSSTSAAYSTMLILDGVTVFSMYVGCLLNRYVKRRVQLLSSSVVGLIFLFGLSLYLYLIKLEVINESNIVTIGILAVFSIAVSCGPGIMSPSSFGEMIPMKYKNLCTIVISVWYQALNSTILKIFPYIYMAFGLHGTFFCYGICMLVLTVVLYKIMPETKGKTLEEMEVFF